jgi:hypothetical protein
VLTGFIFVGVDNALDAGRRGRRVCHPLLSVYSANCPETEFDDLAYIWSVIEEVIEEVWSRTCLS